MAVNHAQVNLLCDYLHERADSSSSDEREVLELIANTLI